MIDYQNKIENFFNKNYIKRLEQISILPTDTGYQFFEKYFITPESGKYRVTIKHSFDEKCFYDLKFAIVYVFYHYFQRYRELNNLEQLDIKLENLRFSETYYRLLTKKAKNEESKGIYASKLTQVHAETANLKKLSLIHI